MTRHNDDLAPTRRKLALAFDQDIAQTHLVRDSPASRDVAQGRP